MKISLITATYNSAETLRDTMQSVLNQTFKDIDYIIVDGGSKDGTLDIVKEYEPLFEGRLRWISEPDKGIYDALNKGILMAKSDIVGIMHSNDFFASNDVLQKVADTFEADDSLDGVYGDVKYVDKQDVIKTVRHYSSAKFKRKKLLMGLIPAHPTFYAKKKCFEQYGLYNTDLKIAADFDMFVRLIWKGNIKTRYIPMTMVIMRTGGASSSGFASHKQTMKEHLASVRMNNLPTNMLRLSLRYFGKIIDLIKK